MRTIYTYFGWRNDRQQSTVDYLADVESNEQSVVYITIFYATLYMLWVEFCHNTWQPFQVFINEEVPVAKSNQRML